MIWLKHERTGYKAPINADILKPGPGGNPPPGNVLVDLLAGTYRIVTRQSDEFYRLSEEQRAELRLNHFVTCPNRSRYRIHLPRIRSLGR